MLTIAVLGTLDTKGDEHSFVADCIRKAGHQALLIDVGTNGPPTVAPAFTRDHVLEAEAADAPKNTQPMLASALDRGQAIGRMANAVPHFVKRLVHQGRIDGIIALGGSGGTSIATAAMRALPLGFPKVMVSTMAGKDVSAYVDISDIVMIPSIVDVSGINRISADVFTRAAAVVVALA